MSEKLNEIRKDYYFFRRDEGSKFMVAKVSSTELTLLFQKLGPLKYSMNIFFQIKFIRAILAY